jgi:glycosyltransferase involved in cell wall biosynthesis
VGFVGFCREWHELDRIVELIADKKYEHLFFLVVGDGPARRGIEAAAEKAGIGHRVHLTGLVSREQMPAWQSAIDIALQPAVVAYASPLKMLEYMACGKAIVAPDQDNIRELLIHEENALLFDPQSSSGFLEAIGRLAADPQLRLRLGRTALTHIHDRKLTWAYNAERILQLCEDLHQGRDLAALPQSLRQ